MDMQRRSVWLRNSDVGATRHHSIPPSPALTRSLRRSRHDNRSRTRRSHDEHMSSTSRGAPRTIGRGTIVFRPNANFAVGFVRTERSPFSTGRRVIGTRQEPATAGIQRRQNRDAEGRRDRPACILWGSATASSARGVVRPGGGGERSGDGAGLSMGMCVRAGRYRSSRRPASPRPSGRFRTIYRCPDWRIRRLLVRASSDGCSGDHRRGVQICRRDCRLGHQQRHRRSSVCQLCRTSLAPRGPQSAGSRVPLPDSPHLIPARPWAGRVCTPCMRCLDWWRCRPRGSAAYYRATRRTQ